MDLDTKLSYLTGFLFTSGAMYMNDVREVAMIIITGFLGGFFGLVGKEFFNWIKLQLWRRRR